VRELAASGLLVLADKGYAGASAHPLPVQGQGKRTAQKGANRAHAQLPGPGERANAPSSKPGASCANSAAAPGRPGGSPKPSTYFRAARSEDEKRSLYGSSEGRGWSP
jgi:hypothetical protein